MPVNQTVYRHSTSFDLLLSRDDWIRTSGLFVPNEARYRAALHPEKLNSKIKEDDSLLQIKID
jgi:hypothetical protein